MDYGNMNYQMPQQQNNYQNYGSDNQIPTVMNYVVTMILTAIPVVGFILMIMWAIGGVGTPTWKSNLARAYFVMMAIAVVLWILFFVLIIGLIGSMF